VTASSVADQDGTLGTRYFEVTASPSPSSGRRSRPPALLASFPTDRPPALPAPRSWHSLGSLGFGLGLRCSLHSSPVWSWSCLSSPVADILLSLQHLAPPRVWPPRAAGKHEDCKAAGDLNSRTLFLFSRSASSSDLAGNEIAAAGTRVGKRDISKISGPRQAWRSRYILTETCIWIEHLAIHRLCLLAHGTPAWQGLGPDLGPQGTSCLAHPPAPVRVVPSTRVMIVSSGLLVLGHPSLLPLCLTKVRLSC